MCSYLNYHHLEVSAVSPVHHRCTDKRDCSLSNIVYFILFNKWKAFHIISNVFVSVVLTWNSVQRNLVLHGELTWVTSGCSRAADPLPTQRTAKRRHLQQRSTIRLSARCLFRVSDKTGHIWVKKCKKKQSMEWPWVGNTWFGFLKIPKPLKEVTPCLLLTGMCAWACT